MNTSIEVKELPEIKLAGIAHIGEFEKTGSIYEKLESWAKKKGLLVASDVKKVTIYHDNPRITELSKSRWSTCMVIDDDIASEGEVRQITTEKGRYAVGHFELTPVTFPGAWDGMFIWIKENGYKLRDGDYFELFHNDCRLEPEPVFIVDICVPVE